MDKLQGHPADPPSEFAPRAEARYAVADQDTDGYELDLGEYIAVVLDNKWFIGAVTGLVTLLGVAIALISTPIYKADVLLLVEEKGSPLQILDDVSSVWATETPEKAEMAILRSRKVIGAVVENLKLDVQAEPRHFPVIGRAIARRFSGPENAVAKPWLAQPQYAWGGEAIAIDTLEVSPRLLGQPLVLVAREKGAFELLDDAGTSLLSGTVGQRAEKEYAAGEKMAIFVSHLKARPGTEFEITRFALLEAIALVLEQLTVSETVDNSGVLGITYTDSDRERATEIVNDIVNVYVRQSVSRRSAEAETTLAFLDEQLPALKARLDSAEVAYNAYRSEKGSVDLVREAQAVLEGIVSTDSEVMALQQQREELRQRFKPAHPEIQALDAKIDRLRSRLSELDQQTEMFPDTQQDVLRLSREVQVNTTLYTELLNKAQELRIAKAGTLGNVTIIDYAIAPIDPIKPKKVVIVALSVLIGLFLAILLAFVRRALRTGLDDPDEAERYLGLPVYACVPRSAAQKKMIRKARKPASQLKILVQDQPEDPAVESIRSLRTTLHFALLDAKSNTIMLTGPAPKVGKSFLSINLGAVLAKAGKRVLVIDADLRNGYLHRYLGISRKFGLCEVLTRQLEPVSAIYETSVEGLEIMPTGALPPNPSEVLSHESFPQILAAIASEYDYVIVDVPPVLAVTDPSIIGRWVGATLLVARAGQHPMRELEQSVKSLQRAGVRLKGMVFNDMQFAGNRYRYGGKYVYQYRYGKT